MARDLLLEIGTEEIPAGFMEKALEDLQQLTIKELTEQRIIWEQIDTYGTPRRLTIFIHNVAEKQADVEEEVKGPSKKVGVDAQGNFTKAAQGFARGQGIELEQTYFKEVNGVEYLFGLKKETGGETATLLPQLLPNIITNLTFPKTMRWGEHQMRFVRPIRWLLALYGEEVMEFELTGIASGAFTYGHRFLTDKPLSVNKPSDYLTVLENGYVIADQKRRRTIIWEQILQLAQDEGGQVKEDDQLLEEVTYLVEYPTALCGTFDEEYLKLPVEVLITSMREHQRYFPVFTKGGKLVNKFITVRNGNSEYIDTVRRGNEKVLAARLADAKFFYEEDLKIPLAERLNKLEDITFQESLGTVLAKVQRVTELTSYLADCLEISPQEKAEALKVASLAKTDLVTNMVYEFPELQGIMGAYYAAAHGESPAICEGIKEHYYPRFAGDVLPQGTAGLLVSMADKLDTIVGCFGVGIKPTGSQDPYGLRRQALAVSHLLLHKGWSVPLVQLLEATYHEIDKEIKLNIPKEKLIPEILEFFSQRIKNILADRGHRYDVIEAVIATGNINLIEMIQWAEALSEFRENPRFNSLLTGYNRASNLAKKGTETSIQPELFVESAEIQLYNAYKEIKEQVNAAIEEKKYTKVLTELAHLQDPIDNFFNQIMVMVEDEKIKNNRLALLNSITDLIKGRIDLTKIVID